MLLAFIVAATFCCARSEARAALETMSITLASQGPSGDSSGSPQVTLYNTDHSIATQAYVSQGGAVDWSNLTYLSGDNHYTFMGDPTSNPSPSQFISFCIELTQDISLNSTYTVDVVSLASAPKPASGPLATGMGNTPAMLISELWAAHFNDIFYNGSQQNPVEPTQEERAAAFQLAIWKLEYDSNNLNYTGNALFQHGFLQVTQNIGNASVGLAEQWVADVVAMNGNGPQANLLAISGHPTGFDSKGNPIYPDFQDQVVEVLPEPATWLLWAMGALGMAARARGRRRGR